jgi:hypothetical protein
MLYVQPQLELKTRRNVRRQPSKNLFLQVSLLLEGEREKNRYQVVNLLSIEHNENLKHKSKKYLIF